MPKHAPDTCKLSAVEKAQSAQGTDGQLISRKPGALCLVAAAYVFGGGGMLAWMGFLVLGPRFSVDLGLPATGSLFIDTLLCLLFFFQHSLMVRRGFRVWLTCLVRSEFHGALYATASGGCLLVLTIFWQPTGTVLWTPPALVFWFMGGIILVALTVGWWGSRSLGEFDALGIKPALGAFNGSEKAGPGPFTIQGPYRWVRHPLYLVSMVIIWSGPVFTADRLLHNLLWTFWILIGATLEEKEMVGCFGNAYRDYQNDVPMLIPKSVKPLVKCTRKYADDHS
jgi:protein-S-isoprenylcysteine O-methyltransferase Ste14